MTSLLNRGVTQAVLVAFLGLGMAASPRQAPAAGDAARVMVWATVTDKQGRFVDDLAASDFVLSDNGKAQPILNVRPETGPLALVILVDRSGSTTLMADRVDGIAEQAIDRLAPADRARIVQFADTTAMSPADFTGDRAALTSVLRPRLRGNATRLWDAVALSASALGTADGHRALLIVSDGDDSRSARSQQDVTRLCQDEGVSVHAIGLFVTILGTTQSPSRDLQALSVDTGGGYFPLKTTDDAGPIVTRAIEGMRRGYLLEFAPPARDNKRHQLEVRVKRPGLTVRSSRGYATPR